MMVIPPFTSPIVEQLLGSSGDILDRNAINTIPNVDLPFTFLEECVVELLAFGFILRVLGYRPSHRGEQSRGGDSR